MKRQRTLWKRPALGLTVAALAGLVSWNTPRAAQADEATTLEVSRSADAEACPDGLALAARVEAIRGPAASSVHTPYHVEFTRGGGQFSAAIRRADSEHVARVLSAPGDSCAALAQATAVTLALILDALQEPPPETPVPAVPSPRVDAVAAPPPPPPPPPSWRGLGSLGAGALLGVTRSAALSVLGELGLVRDRWHLGAGALWAPPDREPFGPGSLRSQLWSGSARACYAAYRMGDVQLSLCGGAMAGAIEVSARNYTRNERKTRLWLAVPVELAVSYRPGPVGVVAGMGALFAVRRHDFSIDTLGPAYESWPVAALLSLQVLSGFPLAPSPRESRGRGEKE